MGFAVLTATRKHDSPEDPYEGTCLGIYECHRLLEKP